MWRGSGQTTQPKLTVAIRAMEIQELTYFQFRSLLGDEIIDSKNPGCAWYASADRRVAARIFLDSQTERWRHSTYHYCHGAWAQHDSRGEEFLSEAELMLFKTLKKTIPNITIAPNMTLLAVRINSQ
jgi:hypothetical protein